MNPYQEIDLSDRRELSGPQLRALGELLIGRTLTQAAKSAGVSRQSVSRWCNEDGPFRQALSDERDKLRQGLGETMLGLCVSAIGVLGSILADSKLDANVRLRAADVALSRAAAAGIWPASSSSSGELIVIQVAPTADEMESEDGSN